MRTSQPTTFPPRRAFSANQTIVLLGCAALALAAGIYAGIRLLNQGSKAPYSTHQGVKLRADMTTRDEAALKASLAEIDELINGDNVSQAAVVSQVLSERYPDHPDVMKKRVEVLLHDGKKQEAYAAIQTYLKVVPTDAPAHFQAGVIANTLGKVEESVSHFKNACSADNGNPQYPLYLGQMFAKQRDWTQAKIYLAAAANLQPDEATAWGTLGQIALEENYLPMATQYMDRARKIDPDSLHWRVLQARILRRENKPAEALTLLNAMPDGDRWTPTVVNEAALCRAMTGDFAGAAKEHLDFLNRDTTATESAIAAARYFIQAKDTASAKQWLGYAQRANPDSAEVKSLEADIAKAESGG